jgi:hypothetical protein
VTDAETYLRELRRALPMGCRRRFVAEVTEHFESAASAEATRGVERGEADRLTIERLGPAHALAGQLLADLRSGALGPAARLSSALTTTRVVLAGVLAIAAVVGVGLVSVRSSSKAPPVQRAAESPAVRNGVEVRRLILTLTNARGKKQQWYAQAARTTPAQVLRLTEVNVMKHVLYAQAGVPVGLQQTAP